MSNDPLARSDIWAGAPNDTEYDAVYAAVTATERGRWFLAEYSNRNRHADTASLVAAMARIEAGMMASKGITANEAPPLDLAAAVERIQDIAFGLRERGVDAALCDALDAAVREICEALASGKPAAAEAPASAHVLIEAAPSAANENDSEDAEDEDLSPVRLFDMEVEASKNFTDAVAALAASLTSLGGEAAPSAEPPSLPAAAVIPPPDDAQASAPAPLQTETTRRWHIEAPDFVFDRPSREANSSRVETSDHPSHAHPLLAGPLLAGTPLPLGPDEDPDDLFEPLPDGAIAPNLSVPASVAAAPEVARSASADVAPIADVTVLPPLRIANGAPAQANSRPPPRDPLADMRGLSEDELIALFG